MFFIIDVEGFYKFCFDKGVQGKCIVAAQGPMVTVAVCQNPLHFLISSDDTFRKQPSPR